ncbi:GLE1-domain-containing protein [Metschnikowia bicuspidata var. bicuspidata NRRL YB-4993]|uniref:mRNA export factor GLE1 n=1 Tax=Metschnikowia bicuspidata var. bicuspidata NRRL YB-4993 TaxID=869754 RepID=A0A1A0H4R2_9ASCO|nr:GLE1-domain-containing protein [Metschnikowia bicuspidata var. bicuspidata NRRL YB-4993]OBA19026.1 GLE1-domain-containing protein [Metschnikowia bicuspidata var. bicuspidata NRRL YB-4993]
MRFGIPADHDVAALPRPHLSVPEKTTSPSPSSSFSDMTSTQSASQILNESLIQLDTLHIRNLSSRIDEKFQKWEIFINESKIAVNSKLSYIDNEFNQKIQALQLDVQKIIDEQIRLREEEKKRLMNLEIEKQRKIKEEADRKRREEEEEERKRRDHQKKLAEEKRLADEKRLAEEHKLKKEKEENEKLERKKEELLKARAEKEAAAKKASAFANPADIEKALLKYRKDIEDIKTNIVGEVDKDKELKKYIGAIKRKVNTKLGQLSNSLRQLDLVSKEITSLIQPLASQPLAYKWILNFVLKAIVSQAETEVTVKPAAALPLGRLAYNLLCNLNGLEFYLSARFVKKCCLVIGYTGTIDTEEGRVRMGWRRSDGKWESEVKYEERMGGILSVWAVIGWVNQTTSLLLFNMKAEWMFLARLLNTKPELLGDVHFVAVCNWWEAAGEKFFKTFGKQAQKLLTVSITDWVPLGVSRSFPAATRLQILGEDLFTKNNFNTLKEMEP